LLREKGIVKPDRKQIVESPRQRVINGFQHYLLQERRLSPATPHNYLPVIDQFLSERFPRKVLNLSAIRAADVTDFVRRHAHQLSPGRAALMVTALRSFFRYPLHRGDVATDLAACVPPSQNGSSRSSPGFFPQTLCSGYSMGVIDRRPSADGTTRSCCCLPGLDSGPARWSD
jgi:hypothetical protein